MSVCLMLTHTNNHPLSSLFFLFLLFVYFIITTAFWCHCRSTNSPPTTHNHNLLNAGRSVTHTPRPTPQPATITAPQLLRSSSSSFCITACGYLLTNCSRVCVFLCVYLCSANSDHPWRTRPSCRQRQHHKSYMHSEIQPRAAGLHFLVSSRGGN